MINLDLYKAIIFDWDGTLVDTHGLILDAHNHVREHYGQEVWTIEHFLGQASQSAREYYPLIYGDKAEEAQVMLYDYVEKHHLNYIKPMDQADLIFEMLGKPLGIVSNKRHSTLLLEVEAMGWTSKFETIIGAGIAEKDKPSPFSLLMGMEQIDKTLRPADILYVGDTETDLLTAQNAGCHVAFIQSDKPRPDLIEKYSPHYVYNDLSEFAREVTNRLSSSNKQAVKI